MSFFEAVTALAFAAFADAPVDVAVIEVGLGGRLDATNIVRAPVAVITPDRPRSQAYLGDTIAAIAAEKAGIIKADQQVIVAAQHPDAIDVIESRPRLSVRRRCARDSSSASIRRESAVGGQVLALRGLHGVYDEVFLPLLRWLPGVERSRARSPPSRRSPESSSPLTPTSCAPRSRPCSRRVASRLFARRRRFLSMRRTIRPVRARRSRRSRSRLRSAAWSAWSPCLVTRMRAGCSRCSSSFLAHVVITQNSSSRSMPADDLAEIAVDIFGADRVDVATHLDEAISIAVERADEDDDEFGGAGVLITGSVVTAGEARRLLKRR